MMNVIKTAIITIIISIISGLLLDYFKRNLCPKILCTIGKPRVMEKNKKKVYAYIIDICNQSNKIIHELTLNVHSLKGNLEFGHSKITKGLKFESSIKNNTLDVSIPFLSKGDKFSVTVYVENCNEPVLTMRSPENFKQIDSIEGENGFLSSLLNKSGDKNDTISKSMRKNNKIVSDEKNDFTMVMNKVSESDKSVNNKNRKIIRRNNKITKNKKIIITAVSIILVVTIGVLGKFYFNGASNDKQAPNIKTSVPKKSNDSKKSSDVINKNVDSNSKASGTNKNIDSKSSTGGTNKNTNSKSSTGGTNKDTNSKASTDKTNENIDSKQSTDNTNENIDSKSSIDGTNENTNSKQSTDEGTEKTDSNPSINEKTGNEGN